VLVAAGISRCAGSARHWRIVETTSILLTFQLFESAVKLEYMGGRGHKQTCHQSSVWAAGLEWFEVFEVERHVAFVSQLLFFGDLFCYDSVVFFFAVPAEG